MRTPSLFAIAGTLTLMSACSKPQAVADDDVRRDLDLALSSTRHPAVISQVESAAPLKSPLRTHASASHAHTAHAQRKVPTPAILEAVPVPARVVVDNATALQPINTETPNISNTAAPDAAPEPVPARTGRGSSDPGVTDTGRHPGDGVIIIRGGLGGLLDPCDERDGHGRAPTPGGGVLVNPRYPTTGAISGGGDRGFGSPGRGGFTGGRGGGVFR